MDRFVAFLERLYHLTQLVWLKPLDKLIRFTGRPSTWFSRLAVWATVGVWCLDVALTKLRGDDYWLADVVFGALFVPIVARFALRQVKRIEQALERGTTSYPIPMDDLYVIVLWGALYTIMGLIGLATLFKEGDFYAVRCLMVSLTCAWLPIMNGGGKSAWARFKEKVSNSVKVPVPQGGAG